MRHRLALTLTVALTVAAATPAAAAADKRIHIQGSRTTSFMWTRQDAKGFRWDISSNGTISDGTNDAYDGGMQLQIQGNSFPGVSTGKLSKDGAEVEIGPWSSAGLQVYRRIFINFQAGYCRWIDIYENPSASEVSVSVRYYYNMGDSTQMIRSSAGKPAMAKGDWGVVTGGSTGSSRPAIVHVFGSKGAKYLPRFQYSMGNDNLYYHVAVKVPPKKAVALCFFEAQRRPWSSAGKFLASFQPHKELRLVPGALRKILLNMGPPALQVGVVEITRDDEADLVVLRNGDEYRGALANAEYALATEFGDMTFPADRVVALSSISAEKADAFIVLTDGQVVAGKLTSGPLTVRLAGGSELPVPVKSIVQAAYRVSPAKPEEIAPASAMLVLRSGPRLAFAGVKAFDFLTPHGAVSIPIDSLRAIEMDTPGGGLHRAIFRNKSVLAGLLPAEKLAMKLELGPSIELSRPRIKRLALVGADVAHEGLTRLTLRNADALYGRFADVSWTVRSRFGDVKVPPAEIAEATFSDDSLGAVKLVLRSGTRIGGKLAGDYVRFAIQPGPELKIHVGHLMSAKGGEAPKDNPKAGAAPAGKSSAAPGASTGPTVRRRADVDPKAAHREALQTKIKELTAARAACTAEAEELKALTEALKKKLGAAPGDEGGRRVLDGLSAKAAELAARMAKLDASIAQCQAQLAKAP